MMRAQQHEWRGQALKTTLMAGAAVLALTAAAYANPQGGEVVSGTATIATPAPNKTQVNQTSEKAIVNWKSFNIKEGESTTFVQPGASSVALNRIFDSNPTVIAGLLSANGRLILVNRNGMMFESGASINTAGLVATTADISNENFNSGNYTFDQAGNPNAKISNAGKIAVQPGGLVAIVAPSVENTGVIVAKLGRIELAGGNTFVLDVQGENLVSFPISADLARQFAGPNGEVKDASVLLSPKVARSIVDDALKVSGDTIANSVTRSGSVIRLTGSGGTVDAGGTLDVGAGRVALSGANVNASGKVDLDAPYGRGGAIDINATNVAALTGSISANGAMGGVVDVTASNLLSAGAISANGSSGAGGSVSLSASSRHIATSASNISANGATAGGAINVSGGDSLFSSGSYSAIASKGTGGSVAVGGREINLIDAKVDASGATGGGAIAVGFSGQGATRAINADRILVSPTSTLKADAIQRGDGGRVELWSNQSTDFMGLLSAKGGWWTGNGGFLEVSSKGEVGFWGIGDASAPRGLTGSLSLDPKYIVISNAGSTLPSYNLIDPSASAGNLFGGTVTALSTGNTVVTAAADDFGGADAGAVYLFNTTTGALVSTLRGSAAGHNVGSGGVTVLSNGNFVAISQNWDNGATANVGAVTWVNGTTGLSANVSSSNSLIGVAANDQVGSGGVVALQGNGNYAVISPNWDNGATNSAGAVTWGNGATGATVGAVTTGNSLVGSNTNDQIGGGGVTTLNNGNYVVRSTNWGSNDQGAVTWRSGAGGSNAAVSSANSLVGVSNNDQVGSAGVTALNNGNYVVASPLWNGTGTDLGAVTWGNGSTGTSGNVATGNSWVGAGSDDLVGSGGVVALNNNVNGNYVIVSPSWDGAGNDRGAITWRSGATSSTGVVGTANSLVGVTDTDQIGSAGVVALSNGHYVVASPSFTNGGDTNTGAVTWANGTATTATTVTSANSFIGTDDDHAVGAGGVVALTNGNYVIVTPNIDIGTGNNHGAVTWRNGSAAAAGTFSTANSMVGNSGDNVGSGGVFALTNGNYAVASPGYDVTFASRGAVTWGNGATGGPVGTISQTTSVIGGGDNDQIGSGGITALSDGSFVIKSPSWDGAGTDRGAVSWFNGTSATTGTVTTANSIVGSTDSDQVGSGGVFAFGTSNYIISSPLWNNGATGDVGAVTLGVGGAATSAVVSTTNSMVGSAASTQLTYSGQTTDEIFARGAGAAMIGLTDPNDLTFARAQSQTMTVNPLFLTRTLNTGTAVTLQASSDITVDADIIANNGSGNGGALTLQAGRSVLLNADITTDNGNLTIVANELLGGGVIDAQRDAGAAELTMAAGADINAGTGNVRLTIASGAGKTITTSGHMTLRNITAANVIAENLGPSNGDVILASGAITASGAGTPIVLASQGGNFINSAGASALTTTAGGARWIVYSQNPSANTLGGLTGSPYYNTPYNSAAPTALSATGNRLAYTVAPTLTVTADNVSRAYGAANPPLTYAVTGGLLGGDSAALALSGAPSLSTSANASSSVLGGPYAITTAIGTLTSDYNYGIALANGALTVTPVALTVTANNANKNYGQTVTFTGSEYSVLGLQNSETAGTVSLTSAGAAASAGVAGSPYAIVASNLTGGTFDATNYAISYVDGALTVDPLAMTITAASTSKTYGQTVAFAGTEFLASGAINGETVDLVTLTSAGAAPTAGVAGSPYAIVASNATGSNGFNAANYAITYVDGALAVNQAALSITADNLAKTYGQNVVFAGTEFSSLGLQNGETIGSVSLASAGAAGTAGVAGSPYAITASGATGGTFDAANYAITYFDGALTVNQAALTITADDLIKTYGQALTFAGTEFSALGLQNGETIGSLSLASTGATAAANVAGSPYTITASAAAGGTFDAANYAISYVNGALTVNPAALTVTANNAAKTYGQALSFAGTEYSILGLQNSETAGTVTLASAGSGAAAGVAGSPYAIVASDLTGGTFNSQNYAISYVDGALTVDPAALLITAASTSKTYGQTVTFNGTEFSTSGLVNSETVGSVSLTSAGAANTAGVAGSPYAITASAATGGTFDAANYAITYADGALTVNQAALTVTANNASKTYGQTTTFAGTEFTSLGLVNSETIGSVTLTSTGAPGNGAVAGSPHAIVASNATGGTFDAANYAITYVNGALTVTPAALTVTADSLIKTYGQNVVFAGTEFTSLGLQNGETIGSVTLTSAGAAATANVAGSPYAITASNATGGSGFIASNYAITYVNGALTVNPAALMITADDLTKTYGQTVTFAGTEFDATGLQNGETVGSVTLASAGAANTANVAGSPYAITVSNATGGTFNAANYTIGYTGGLLTVNPAALTVTANNLAKTYGQTGAAFTGSEFTTLGLQNGETVGTVTLTSAGLAANAGVAGSPYAIVASNLTGGTFDAANYAISYVDGALTVNPAALTITALDAPAKTYGQTVTFAGTEFNATGLVNGETISTVTLTSTGAAPTGSVLGSPHAIVASSPVGGAGFDAANYAITYVNGSLVVNPAALMITAFDAAKTYGQTQTFAGTEFSSVGLQNGETIGAVTLTSAGAAPTAGVAGSPYAIVASNPTGGAGFVASNYAISYTNGALTVNPAALTVTANDRTKTYGDTVVFAGTEFTSSGLVNGETISSVTLTSAGAAAGASVPGGPYAIVASNAIGGGTFSAANYAVTYVDGVMTVNPAQLYFLANYSTRLYGDANPALSGSIIGFRNGETVATATTGALAFTTAATAASNVGTYAIDGGGVTVSANYTIAQSPFNATAFAITPSTLTYVADTASRLFGEPNPAFTGTVTGFKNGETEASATTGLALFSSPLPPYTLPGSYAITGSGLVANNGNYVFVQATGNATALTILDNPDALPAAEMIRAGQEGLVGGDGVFNPKEEGGLSAHPNEIDTDAGTVTDANVDDGALKRCLAKLPKGSPTESCGASAPQ